MEPRSPDRSPKTLPEKLLAALLLLSTLLAYFPCLKGGMVWDDDAHVTQPELRSLHGLKRIWTEVGATQQYYPVLHTAFWAEHRLWGDSVLGYHLANVLLHSGAALLLVLVLRRLSISKPAAWLSGFLFALHPVCVESVAWISEQKNTLSAVFYLGSALAYLRFDDRRRRGMYFMALGLFVLALLTKSVTATLPAALLLVFWWRRGRIGLKRDVLPLVPWFLLAILGGLFTAWIEQSLIGAEGSNFELSWVQRLLLAGHVLWFYLGKLFWPNNLLFTYPRWAVDPHDPRLWVYPFGAAVLAIGLVYLARRRRGPLTGFLFFVGTLAPVLGFVNVYPFLFSFVADHFQYLASLGVLVPVAWGLSRTTEGLGGLRGSLALACLPAILAGLVWRQSGLYRDSDTLNRATLRDNPSCWLAHYNLGVSLSHHPERIDEAISEYRATLRLNPDHWPAHNNLASMLLLSPGHEAEAIEEYQAALRIRPDFAEAQSNLGMLLGRTPGKTAEALSHLNSALRLRPQYDEARNNLGVVLLRSGSRADAIQAFEEAIRIDSNNPEYHYNLANALSGIPGRLPQAVDEYHAAIRLRPGYLEAHSNLGAALARMPGGLEQAIAEYRIALKLGPQIEAIHANLANALSHLPGNIPAAIAEYEAALRLNPDDAQAHTAVGVLLADQPGRLDEAISQFRESVRLRPNDVESQFCLGFSLGKSGKRREAVEHLQKALDLRPDFAPARQLLDRLQ